MQTLCVLFILLWLPVVGAQDSPSLPEVENPPVSTEIMNDSVENSTSKDGSEANEIEGLKRVESRQAVPFPRAEVRQDLKTVTKSQRTNAPFYVSVQTGALNYPQVLNIPTLNGAAGLAVGFGLGDSWSLEGGFIYSFQQQDIQQINQIFIEDIDQFLVSGQLKYHFRPLPSVEWFTLSPGAVLTYNRRIYNGGVNDSDAVDAGASASADIRLSSTLSLGLEYRFMANLDYQRANAVDSSAAVIQQFVTGNSSFNLEEAQYQILMLQLKAAF